ncbi:twin-arginine translocase subunit TatC [bacterium]|nr:MAG: twin-arginine translocase subunit TatC [bacterium]
MRVLGVLLVAWIAGWFAVMPVYGYIEGVINRAVTKAMGPGHEYRTIFDDVTQPFMLKFKLSFYIALAIVLPYIVVQIWGFVAPALKENEQRPFKRLAPASAILFIVGAGFAWAIVPTTFGWFASYTNEFAGNDVLQKAGNQVFLVVKMLLAFGVAFQLPIIVYGIGIAGLLSTESLLKYWRHAASVIFVLSAIITPSNDPISMLMMAVPLTVLFIASVYAVKFTQRKQTRPEAEDHAPMAVLDMGEPIAYPETTEIGATEERRQTLE